MLTKWDGYERSQLPSSRLLSEDTRTVAMAAHRSDRNRDRVGRATGPGKRVADPVGMFELYRRHPCPLLGGLRRVAARPDRSTPRKVQAQRETVELLKNQLDRQASTNTDLQRQLARSPPSCKRSLPSMPIPLWDSASTWVAPGSTGHRIIPPRSSTGRTTMDYATGATLITGLRETGSSVSLVFSCEKLLQ